MKRFRQIFIAVVMFLLLFSALAYSDTWTANKRLTRNAGISGYPEIAVDGSNIYVVWQDDTPGNYDIYLRKSEDGGAAWEKTKRLTSNAGSSQKPAIAVNGSNIYVVWQDDTPGNWELYFKKSDDGGATWPVRTRLTRTVGHSVYPEIAVDGPNVYVVWHDNTPGNWELYFKKSDDGGATWESTKRLTTNEGRSLCPEIAVDGPNVYVVWQDDIPGNDELYFKKSDDGGATWTTNKRLTNNAGSSNAPAIAVNGSNIYVVWHDDIPGSSEIYLRKSEDGGATWTTAKNLSNNSGKSQNPAIAVDGPNVYAVWEDYTSGGSEIYLRKSEDEGITWPVFKRLTRNTGTSWDPAIAVDGPNIYVVWDDNTPGNFEIYLKKGVLY